jgi:hypothetical protein
MNRKKNTTISAGTESLKAREKILGKEGSSFGH